MEDDAALQSLRFRRGPDRRLREGASDNGRRPEDRRVLGIRWIALFRDADEQTVNDALSECEVLLLPAGTPLLKPGEANHSVYIPLSGRIAAQLDIHQRPESAITIAAGECIGELSAIDGKPVSALVLALTDARVLRLPRDVFWEQLMALPGVARNLMITLSARMRRTNDLALQAQREQLELIHLKKELDVARQLQTSMLPMQRPLFPERYDIEACGFMEPTSDVGGDLFDAFFVDEHRLFFCIGDVSGHGIAAALFMARTIGLLRILAMDTEQPDRLLELLNDRLCVGNETNLFVTMFCGFLDLQTGTLRYSNGGHCAPVLYGLGTARLLPIPKGALVGAFPGLRYLAMEHKFAQGEMLFCYTDGVTEAENTACEQYSEERCIQFLKGAGAMPLPALLDAVRHDVASFRNSKLLDDDCTMLAVKRPAPKSAAATTPV